MASIPAGAPPKTHPAARAARSVLLASLMLLCGCGDSRPDRVPVSGKVMIDGQPLSKGNIKFVPSGGRPSAAKIQPDGSYTMTCYDGNDGVIPGTHRVQVSALEVLGENKVRWHAPKKYADFRTSELTYQINEPNDDLTIELTWSGGRPFVE